MTNKPNNTQVRLKDSILDKADQCVYCGMCLPVCPTYQLSQQEAESPRGRLSLLSAYYKGELLLDDALSAHLDNCLLCRSCESICPASVPFADIMDEARNDMNGRAVNKPRLKRVLLKLMENKKRTKFLINTMNKLSLGKLIARSSYARTDPLRRYLHIINTMKAAPKWQTFYPGSGKIHDTVGLFVGCVHEFVDIDSLKNCIKVLNKLGVNVYVPEHQQCCGAMHQHAGEIHIAKRLFDLNQQAFSQYKLTAVISLSSACTVTLKEREQTEQGGRLMVTDICTYLEDKRWFENQSLATINAKVLLHFPCTQKNVLKNTDTIYQLLARIPGLTVQELNTVNCCGAAGTYMLDNPEWSDKLKQKAANSIDYDVEMLVTSNIGCLMQFRDIVSGRQQPNVLHPVDIVARSLGCE